MKSTIAVLLGLLLALTACGSEPDQQAGAKKDNSADMVKFAQCMRDNGIDMPDPKQADNGGVMIEAMPGVKGDSAPLDEEKMKSAHEACKKHLPNGGEFKPPSPEEQDEARKQAKCMRDKGHDWPDPDFDGGAGEPRTLPNLDDDKVKQDMKDCGLGEGGMVAARPVG